MHDTFIIIIGMVVAIILIVVVPFMATADRNDDITQQIVNATVSDIVDEVVKTRELTNDQYINFASSLATTGNAYDIEIEIRILDENAAKKNSQTTGQIVVDGNNSYYSIFTQQITEELAKEGKITLKPGDIIIITVKNRSDTFAQTLRNVIYRVIGNSYSIYSRDAGTVT